MHSVLGNAAHAVEGQLCKRVVLYESYVSEVHCSRVWRAAALGGAGARCVFDLDLQLMIANEGAGFGEVHP
jgi:hypothetical protein